MTYKPILVDFFQKIDQKHSVPKTVARGQTEIEFLRSSHEETN